MNQKLAKVLSQKITGLPFLERVSGLVRVAEKPIPLEDGLQITKFPVSADNNWTDCLRSGCFADLVPNSKVKGIAYFEDFGTRTTEAKNRNLNNYESKLRLVVWINNALIQQGCESLSVELITHIRNVLEEAKIIDPTFVNLNLDVENIVWNEYSLFEKYDYKKAALPYLFHPYEAFGIDYKISYSISKYCVPEFILNPKVC